MDQLNYELNYLKETFIEFMEVVNDQLEKSYNCLFSNDLSLADEVVRNEKRVNAIELSIEKNCENILALFHPVATDLRLVTSIFKSISDVERMGDHANFIAKMVLERSENSINSKKIKDYKIDEIANMVIDEWQYIIQSFEDADSSLARKIFIIDNKVNKIYRKQIDLMKENMLKSDASNGDFLDIYAIIARLERSSNLLSNIAEDIIFYIDAVNLKHKKKKKLIFIKDKENSKE